MSRRTDRRAYDPSREMAKKLVADRRTRQLVSPPARQSEPQELERLPDFGTQRQQARRYVIVKYSAERARYKCMECGEEDYTHILVDNAARYQGVDQDFEATPTSIACWCDRCLGRLAVDMFEAVGM